MDDVEEDSNEATEMQNKNEAATAAQIASKPNAHPNHNGLNPFANQYLQYPNFAFDPNAPRFPQVPNFPQPQHYPHSPQFQQSSQNAHASSSHLPKIGALTSNQGENVKDEEPRVDDAESGNQSNTEPSPEAQDNTQSSTPASNIPQKNQNPPKNQINQIPPNYLPYYNYFNSFNPNQYYQNSFDGGLNGGKNPNVPAQYSAPNQQFNQYNPQYNPYNYQPPPPPPPNYYSNSQYTPYQGATNSHSNRKKQKTKRRPNENENEPTTESTMVKNTYNRRTRPTTRKKVKPTQSGSSQHTTEQIVEKIEVIDADKDFDSDE